MSYKNGTPALIFSLLFALGLVGAAIWWFTRQPVSEVDNGLINAPIVPSLSLGQIERRLSLGSQLLVATDSNPEKQAGIRAFAAKDFATAIQKFQAALQAQRNDPEALIYLNNAKAAQGKTLQIAVSVPIGGKFVPIGDNSVPIGSNFDVAKEILRGVAQVQDEVNQRGGINGVPLQVVIANDSNDPAIARQIANAFVQDSKVLAVVGHTANEVSIAAAPLYQKGRLVMISPTSQAKQLANTGSYIFRTIPTTRFVAGILSRHRLRTASLKKLAICSDSKIDTSQSLKEEITTAIAADGGQVSSIKCDFAATDFEPQALMGQIVDDGADGLLLSASVDKFTQAIEMARANGGRLPLLGSSALYALRTLELGQSAVDGMVLAVNWHPDVSPGNPFVREAKARWGEQFTWRTAMAYDATQAIITGLQSGASREGLQKMLASEKFSAPGATGTIQFLPSGDRSGAAFLVKIQPGNKSGQGYDFVPLK